MNNNLLILGTLGLLMIGFGGWQMTRGIRNNNPGNIRKSNIDWQGKVPGNDLDFETFSTPIFGIRALAVNLKTYFNRYGLDTINEIISRWAPPNENDTAAYISNVSQSSGFAPGEVINLNDPTTLTKIVKAIIKHENGIEPYDVATIANAVNLA